MKKLTIEHVKKQLTFQTNESYLIDYFQSSVLVPLIEIDGEYHLVFEKRAATIRQGGEICFPGGKIDATDISPQVTAIRETHEELGCSQEDIEILGTLDTLMMPNGMMVYAYVGLLKTSLEELTVSADEVEKVFTVPVAYFLETAPVAYQCQVLIHPYLIDPQTGEKEILLPVEELGLPQRYQEPWGAGQQQILFYQTEELIWGLTAKIIANFVAEIKK